MTLRSLASVLDEKIYYMLLFTVAIIPLHQEFAAVCTVLTFFAAAFVAIVKGRQQPAVLKEWQQALLFLLFIAGWASLHFSRNQFISSWNYVYVAGQYSAMVFVLLRYGWKKPQVFGEQSQNLQDWRKFFFLPRPMQLLGAFLLVSVLVSSIGIAQKLLGVTAEGIWVDPAQFPDLKVRVFSTLVNPNILAGYLVLVIAYAAAFFNVFREDKRLRLGLFCTGVLAALCLLYTYSRGNWLACAVMLFAYCVLFYRKAFLPIMAGGTVALVVGGNAVMQRLASITSGQDTSAALRLAYLHCTKMIIEDFPMGVGWYGYRFIYPEYNYYLADTSVIMYHCHNIFLNVLAELGWQGFIVFMAVWAMFVYNGWQLAFKGRVPWVRAIGQGYVLAVVGIAVGGLTDHVYFNTQMGLLFWVLGTLVMISRKLEVYCNDGDSV